MRHTFFKLWVHGILHIADNSVAISTELETLFYEEIEKKLLEQGCEVSAVGGRFDHIHVLFLQNPLLSLHDTMRYVQDFSAHWYQKHDFTTGFYRFGWHEGYAAFSVSESARGRLKGFIEEQNFVHQTLNFSEEMTHLNRLHGVDTSDVLF